MKSIYSEAKQQLGNCVLHDSNDTAAVIGITTSSPTTGLNNNFIDATTETTTSTYDTLQRPFKCDRQRGRWSTSVDFYFACTSHAFGSIMFSELPVYALLFGGVFFLPAYLLAIVFYAIPVFAIQTFLGQFSTSGAISAFRVSPIFKGIGYSILLLNLSSLAYYGIIAAVPLIYAANSLHTVIPWMSCDNAWNTPNCSEHNIYNEETDLLTPHATIQFFRSIIRSTGGNESEYALSWPILCGVVGVWFLTLGILLKKISFIGKFFRCLCIFMLTFFVAIMVHLFIYVGITWDLLVEFTQPTIGVSTGAIVGSCRAAILMSTWMLGPGWGSVLTLASHNNFRCNSEKLTYWVSGTHAVLAIISMICGRIALDHFEDDVGLLHFHVEEEHNMQFLYLCYAYLFGSLTSLPNLWSFLFFAMLFIAELSAVIIQMMTVLTAIFDEHEKLRKRKVQVTVGLVMFMMLVSTYFCTKRGFEHLHILPTLTILTHVSISMVMLLMTTWVYGRERFQCDLQFMFGKTISNFKIFLIRFITPFFMVINIFQIIYMVEREETPTNVLIISQSLVYFLAPVYVIHKICQTSGSLRHRLKQCFAPHDWHPVDSDNRRFYEEVMGTSEMLVIDSDSHIVSYA